VNVLLIRSEGSCASTPQGRLRRKHARMEALTQVPKPRGLLQHPAPAALRLCRLGSWNTDFKLLLFPALWPHSRRTLRCRHAGKPSPTRTAATPVHIPLRIFATLALASPGGYTQSPVLQSSLVEQDALGVCGEKSGRRRDARHRGPAGVAELKARGRFLTSACAAETPGPT
jgi:hypothetical protein